MNLRHRTSVVLLVAATGWLAAGAGAPAQADPSLRQLQDQATDLRHRLDQLSVQQGLAVEQYDAAADALQQATTAQVLATAALNDAQRAAVATDHVSARRARALYMSGGRLGLTATVLASTSLSDVLNRWQAVASIVRDDARTSEQRRTDVVTAEVSAADVERARALTGARRVAADQAVASVQASLAAQTALLASTDSAVVALADRQRRAAEASALARAATSAARLGIATGPAPTAGATSGWPALPAASGAAATAIAAARTRLGLPYVWGATGPDSFDCSGLTGWAYRQAGVSIPRTSRQQFAALPRVALNLLQPGDLVFYASSLSDPSTIHHVALYLGAGLSLYAPQTGSVVKVGPVGYGPIIGAVRPAPSG